MSRVRRPARCSGPAAPEHGEAAADEDGHAGSGPGGGAVGDVGPARRVARDSGRPRRRPGVEGRRRGGRQGKCDGGNATDEELASGQLPSPSHGHNDQRRADGEGVGRPRRWGASSPAALALQPLLLPAVERPVAEGKDPAERVQHRAAAPTAVRAAAAVSTSRLRQTRANGDHQVEREKPSRDPHDGEASTGLWRSGASANRPQRPLAVGPSVSARASPPTRAVRRASFRVSLAHGHTCASGRQRCLSGDPRDMEGDRSPRMRESGPSSYCAW